MRRQPKASADSADLRDVGRESGEVRWRRYNVLEVEAADVSYEVRQIIAVAGSDIAARTTNSRNRCAVQTVGLTTSAYISG